MASEKGKWLQSELLKLPTTELVNLSSWLQEVVKARSALEQLEAPFAQEVKPAEAPGSSEVKPEPLSPPVENPPAPNVPAPVAPAAVPATVPTPAPPTVSAPVAPAEPTPTAPVPAPAVQPAAVTSGTARERSRSRSSKRQAPVAVPESAPKAEQSEPKQLAVEPKVDPVVPACNGHAAPKGPEHVANGPAMDKSDVAPPSKPSAEPATVKESNDVKPATPAEHSVEKPTAQPEEGTATRSSLALNADHSELMSSLWSAFGTANSWRSKVTQAEQNLCGMQSQLQMAMQKAEEAFVAVQHWAGMVEQTKMEQMTFANMCYDPTMQAQAQQRVATAMQSHAFAQQSGERAMQQRQSVEVALQNAQSVLMTEQAEMKKAGHELKEVVKRAEAFLKENSNALPQDKVQPLCALCTRFMSFAQQLGAGQEEVVPGSMQAMPKAAQAPAPGINLHPLADYQQRVMILEEQKTDENQMDELFASQEEDVAMANFNGCGGNVAATGSGGPPGPVPPGAVAPGQDQLAAYKNRLMEEASYLQAVFGGKKPDGTPDPGAGPCGNMVS